MKANKGASGRHAALGVGRRSLLLIAYYFPPLGGIGVQRSLRFARYLPEHGWDVTVLRPSTPTYPVRDDSIGKGPRDDAYLVKSSPILDLPQRPYRVHRWLADSCLLFPDEHAGWVPLAAVAAKRLAVASDVVMSSAPPISGHVIAMRASEATGRPWVADFRDPYTENVHFAGGEPATTRHNALRDSIIAAASAITVVSNGMVSEFDRLGETKTTVVQNGFDPDDFRDLRPMRYGGRHHIVYAGSLYGVFSPADFFRGLGKAIARNAGIRGKLRVSFVGNVADEHRFLAASLGLSDVVEFLGFRPRGEALALMAGADSLLFMLPAVAGDSCILTGKIFEYLALGIPILGVLGVGEARDLLARAGGCLLVEPSDHEGIAHALEQLTTRGSSFLGTPDPKVVKAFSADSLAERLAGVLDSVVH
jgi:glycosyltransferase involved in cell wall biosynthesis